MPEAPERLQVREMECSGKADPEFLDWAAQYDAGIRAGGCLAKHQTWLAARTCPVLELRGDLTVRERVAAVMKHLTGDET